MSIRSSLFLAGPLTQTQISNVRTLIAGMKAGTMGSTKTHSVYGAGPSYYGMVNSAHTTLANKRLVDGLTRQQLGAWVELQFQTLTEVNPVVAPPAQSGVVNLIRADITAAQRTALEAAIQELKSDSIGTTEMRQNGEAHYGLVDGAITRLRTMRTNAPYMSRKQIGYLLSEQLTNVVIAQPVTQTKRPNSFSFRKLTAERLKMARRLIRDLKSEVGGTSFLNDGNRLDYGLTALAVSKLDAMTGSGKTRRQRGAWLDAQLAKALREQEAAAHVAGNGKRRVQFS